MKRLLTFLTIVLVAITAFIPVASFAADENLTLTITAPSNVDMSTKTITIYKLFDLETEGAKDSKVYYYSWKELGGTEAFFASKGKKTIIEATEYIRTLSGTDLTLLAEEYYTFCKDRTDVEKYTISQAETVEFTGLDKGYYLVYDVQAESDDTAKSVAILANLEKETEIPLKIETVTVEKEADQTSANVGDTVTFTVTSTVPDTTGYTSYSFVVNDTMSKGLDFNNDVKVFIDEVEYDKTTVTFNKDTSTGLTTINITFDENEFIKLEKDKKIKITYSADLNQNSIQEIENSNEVKIIYSNDPTSDSTGITVPVKVYVYTYTVDFTKKNTKGEALEAAQFVLKYTDDSNVTKYVKFVDGELTLVDSQNDATTYTSGKDGTFSISGLKEGTYTLVETLAPDGYSLPNFDGFTFTIAQELDSVGKLTSATFSYISDDNNVVAKGYMTDTDTIEATLRPFAINVLNAKGDGLPSTGGIGTTIFTIIGISVMALSGIALALRSKKVTE